MTIVFLLSVFVVFIVPDERSVTPIIVLTALGGLALVYVFISMGFHILDVFLYSSIEYAGERIKGKKHEESLKAAGGKAIDILTNEVSQLDSDISKNPLESKVGSVVKNKLSTKSEGLHPDNLEFPVASCIKCCSEVFPFLSVSSDLLMLDSVVVPGEFHRCIHLDWGMPVFYDIPVKTWDRFRLVSYGLTSVKGRFIESERFGEIYDFEILEEFRKPWSRYWNGEPVFIGKVSCDIYFIISVVQFSRETQQLGIKVQLKEK